MNTKSIVTQAICLSSSDYQDYDRLVKLFSVDYGIITARFKSVKKSGAKLKMSSEVFCLAEYTLIRKGDNTDFYQVIGANIIDSFFESTKRYEQFTMSNALLEMTLKSLPEKTPLAKIYINLLKSLKAICYEGKHSVYVVCHYMCYLLDFLGYKLNFLYCANCNEKLTEKIYFDFEKGSFLCHKCNEYGKYTDKDFIKFLNLVAKTPLADSNLVNFEQLNLKPILSFLTEDLQQKVDKNILSIKNYLEFLEYFQKNS